MNLVEPRCGHELKSKFHAEGVSLSGMARQSPTPRSGGGPTICRGPTMYCISKLEPSPYH